MPEARAFEIGGIRFCLEPDRADLEVLLPGSFTGFTASSADRPYFRVCLEAAEEMAPDPLGFFLPHRFEVMEEGRRFRFVNRHDRLKVLGHIDPAAGEARLLLPPEGLDREEVEVTSAISTGLSDFLKSCLQVFLLEGGGTLLHACGVTGEGRGFLLMGPSGAGKSTAARLLQEKEGIAVLNDDLVALSAGDGGVTLWGTPWTGSRGGTCRQGSAPLKAAYSLRRGERSEAVLLERKEALKELLANLPWMGEGEGLTHPTISAAAAIAGAVPVYRLTFRLEDDLWELLRESAER